ncbi:MAG TPA: hypothetical protein VHS99_16435 [Chloroflexota bacterium]|jgi:hypothetical protein|nr:hypothetical protein [Chloroflexota bacterium]
MYLRPSWRPGFLLPLVVIIAFVTDVTLRLLPVEGLAFRPWEAVRRYRPASDAFEPNQHFYKEHSYGVLAALGNMPERRQYRAESFTTDAYGYRNLPEVAEAAAAGRVEAMLVGSSMATGVGNNDDETLAVQLTRRTGRVVYNASLTFDLHSLERIRSVAGRLGLGCSPPAACPPARPGLVIFEYLESYDLPDTRDTGVREPCFRLVMLAGWRQFDPLCTAAHGLARVSPLRIFAERSFQQLQDDRVLPNVRGGAVVQGTLQNGEVMLFSPVDVAQFRDTAVRPTRPAALYLSQLAAELRRDELQLLVVLLPGAYTVYSGLLAEPVPPPAPGTSYFERLEGELRAAGVPVVNLTAPFVAGAERDLAQGEYIYWRDDHHWNRRGIALGAEEVAKAWDRLREGGTLG